MVSPADAWNAPRWQGQAPFYEDWYAKANLPEGESLWVRYTIRAPVEGPAEAAVWAIADLAEGHVAARKTATEAELDLNGDPFVVSTPHGRLTGTGCRGELGELAFELSWEPTGYVFTPLPGWGYRLPASVSKTATPNPDLSVDGQLAVDGEVRELQGVPGQQGHVWGIAHADRWAWAHDNAGPGPVVSVVTAQRRLPGLGRPTLALALVRHEGETIAFRNPLANRARFDGDGLEVLARSSRARLHVTVAADDLGRLTYVDPDGSRAYCHNTKSASADVTLERRGLTGLEEVGSWHREATTAFEVGQRAPIEGVPALLED